MPHVINLVDHSDMDTDPEDPDDKIILGRFIVRADHPARFTKFRVIYDDPESDLDLAIMQVEEVAEEYNFCKFSVVEKMSP